MDRGRLDPHLRYADPSNRARCSPPAAPPTAQRRCSAKAGATAVPFVHVPSGKTISRRAQLLAKEHSAPNFFVALLLRSLLLAVVAGPVS